MYLFVTFGEPGMKGVQIRGARVADALRDQGETVEFLNDGEESWLVDQGYTVHRINIHQFSMPDHLGKTIFDTLHPQAIIFAELPTGWPYPTAVLFEANRRRVPVIVFDNLYSGEQLHDRPFHSTIQTADLVVFNSLASVTKPSLPHVRVIPPLIHKPTPEKIAFWHKQLKLAPDQTLITMVGYHNQAREIAQTIYDTLPAENQPLFILITGETTGKLRHPEQNLIISPFLAPEDLIPLYSLSEVIIGKHGYMQFLEAIALGKIFISLGTTHGYKTEWLEPPLQAVDLHFDEPQPAAHFLCSLLQDAKKINQLKATIKKLHDGRFYNPTEIATWISETVYRPKTYVTKVFLCYGEKNIQKELARKVTELTQHDMSYIYPLVIYKNQEDDTIAAPAVSDYIAPQKYMLNASFAELFTLSSHSFHSLAQIYPWYNEIVSHIINILTIADEVLVYDKQTEQYFHDLLQRCSPEKIKIMS